MSFEHTRTLALGCIAALAAAIPAHAADYVQAGGSALTFATQYQGEVFNGRVPKFDTRLRFDPAKLASARLDVTFPLSGVTVGNPEGDEALRGADFFNISKFPQARFSATKFRRLGGNRYAADGALSLRGVSKPVTLTFTWTPGLAPVLQGKATVRRLNFGVGGGDWADTSLIPDDVAINTKVVFKPAK